MSAGLAWYCVNQFVVERPDGFDPFRYEYFAREGLPDELLLATGYRVVVLLQWLYEYLPYFFGFTVFCGVLHSSLALATKNRAILFALFNPITFYYLGQTGKDGIGILAYIAMAMIAIGAFRSLRIIPAILVISLAIIIRPPVAIFLLPIFLLFRHGPRSATIASLLLGLGFLALADIAGTADSLFDLVTRDDETDVSQSAREFSFGTGLPVIAIRVVLYYFSVFYQPIVGVAKFISAEEFFLLYEAVCYLAILAYIVHKQLVRKFLTAALPFVLLVAIVFPFYHFRYLVATYPIVLAFVIAEAGPRSGAHRSRRHHKHTPNRPPAEKQFLEPSCTNG